MAGGGGSTTQVVGYRYKFGIHMGVCRGPVDELVEIRAGDRTAWTGNVSANTTIPIDAPNLFGGESGEGGIQGDLYVMMGGPDQVAPALLDSMLDVIGITGGNNLPDPTLIDGTIESMYQGGPVTVEFRTDGTAWATVATNTYALPNQWLSGAPIANTTTALYEMRVSGAGIAGRGSPQGDTGGAFIPMTAPHVIGLLKPNGEPIDPPTDPQYACGFDITIRQIANPAASRSARLVLMATQSINEGDFWYGGGA